MTGSIFAYVWRSGLIEYGQFPPEGTLPVLQGPEFKIRKIIEILTNPSNDDCRWVLEMTLADNDMDATRAAVKFADTCMAKSHEYDEAERKMQCLH